MDTGQAYTPQTLYTEDPITIKGWVTELCLHCSTSVETRDNTAVLARVGNSKCPVDEHRLSNFT